MNEYLKTEIVAYEKSATHPTDPTRQGYTFTGWDLDFSNITRDVTLKAQYSLITSVRNQESNAINIYPNPSKGVFIIESVRLNNKITIVNNVGALVYTSFIKDLKHTLDISDLNSGIYFIKIGEVIKK
ncbi:hypothetical protein GCM10011506_03070 [Marivirga lumbricoides]|uniref:Secretion system C-terminal sorting domain-containing protein n=1 Tax=Marivirga lumbricoides TaxID=1046115 RepID=A0ABQ1L9N9_9BACT|nr:hypothetical protein GCM10011506_03070 [Marivirga lumbricoides]